MALALPQLSFIPNASQLLASIVQVTGLQKAIDAFSKAQSIVKAGDFTPESVDDFLIAVKALLTAAGPFVPGGAFAGLQDEVDKYEKVVAAIESGEPTEIAQYEYASKSGKKYLCKLSLEVDEVLAV